MPGHKSSARPFLGSVDIDEFFGDAGEDAPDRKAMKRVVRDISKANKATSFYWKAAFAGLELLGGALTAGLASREAPRAVVAAGTALLPRMTVPLAPTHVLAAGAALGLAQVFMAVFIVTNTRRVRLYMLARVALALTVASVTFLAYQCAAGHIVLSAGYVSLLAFCCLLELCGYGAERMSYRAEQGIYEMKKAAVATLSRG